MALVKEEHLYEKGPAETMEDLQKAISSMGTVKAADPEAHTVQGRIKYGLGARTSVKAKVQQQGAASIIHFESRGGDVFGRAARDNVEHLLEAMRRGDDDDFEVEKASKKQWMNLAYLTVMLSLTGVSLVIVVQTGRYDLVWLPALPLLLALAILRWQRARQQRDR